MKLRRVAIMACLWILVAGCGRAEDPIGQVAAIQGEAVAVGADGQERKLELKSSVYMNDKLVTGAGTKIQVVFSDESTVFEGESSELMVDQYVYSPDSKADNQFMVSILKGVARVISGKITQMNPARFKVKTTMALTGIRGCELGFRVKPTEEIVYIIRLSTGEAIAVERTSGLADDDTAARQKVEIRKERMLVAVPSGQAMVQRAMTAAELNAIIADTTPMPSKPGVVGVKGTGDKWGLMQGEWQIKTEGTKGYYNQDVKALAQTFKLTFDKDADDKAPIQGSPFGFKIVRSSLQSAKPNDAVRFTVTYKLDKNYDIEFRGKLNEDGTEIVDGTFSFILGKGTFKATKSP